MTISSWRGDFSANCWLSGVFRVKSSSNSRRERLLEQSAQRNSDAHSGLLLRRPAPLASRPWTPFGALCRGLCNQSIFPP